MVRRVEVLAVPAGRETQADHDARRARAGWEPSGVRAAGVCCLQACVDQAGILLDLLGRAEIWIADRHAEAWLERGCFAVGEVVHRHTTVGVGEAQRVAHGGEAVEGPVPCSEEHHSSPVV